MFRTFVNDDCSGLPTSGFNGVQFNMLYDLMMRPHVTYKSDDGNVVAVVADGKPVWIWVNEGVAYETAARVLGELVGRIKFEHKISAAVAAPFYAKILGGGGEEGMVADAYACTGVGVRAAAASPQAAARGAFAPTTPQAPSWKIISPQMSDINTIARFLNGFNEEAFGIATDAAVQLKNAAVLIKTKRLYCLYDKRIVSMGYIIDYAGGVNAARLNLVYTDRDYRRSGYGRALVSALTSKIVSSGKMALLYVNSANTTAAGIYKSIGYVYGGSVVEVKI